MRLTMVERTEALEKVLDFCFFMEFIPFYCDKLAVIYKLPPAQQVCYIQQRILHRFHRFRPSSGIKYSNK